MGKTKMQTLNVLHRADGKYEVAANEHDAADTCLVPYEFVADMLPAMTYRAKTRGYSLNIVEEPTNESAG